MACCLRCSQVQLCTGTCVCMCETTGWDVAQLVRASDRHATDAGSIPLLWQGIFLPDSTFSADPLTVSVHHRAQSCMHLHPCVRERSCSPCQSSVDYGNTKTPSMHPRFGSATLLQLAFPGDGNPNFLWEKWPWDNTVIKSI